MILTDVDRLLATSSEIHDATPVTTVRALRDDLAQAAVSLSYARHVLSVDAGVLHHLTEGDDDLQQAVDDLPAVLAAASIGGGWSLSSDAPATMAAADLAVAGEADGLLTAHAALATTDLHSPEEVARITVTVENQLAEVTDRRELVEQRLRELQGLIVRRYQRGDAKVDDWLD
jgi:hypothetical protein